MGYISIQIHAQSFPDQANEKSNNFAQEAEWNASRDEYFMAGFVALSHSLFRPFRFTLPEKICVRFSQWPGNFSLLAADYIHINCLRSGPGLRRVRLHTLLKNCVKKERDLLSSLVTLFVRKGFYVCDFCLLTSWLDPFKFREKQDRFDFCRPKKNKQKAKGFFLGLKLIESLSYFGYGNTFSGNFFGYYFLSI